MQRASAAASGAAFDAVSVAPKSRAACSSRAIRSRTGAGPAGRVQQVRGRLELPRGQQLVNAGKGAEHLLREKFRIMMTIERSEPAHHRVGAANRLHRAEGSALRYAEQDQPAHALASGLPERGARDQSAHAVGDHHHFRSRVGAQPRRQRLRQPAKSARQS